MAFDGGGGKGSNLKGVQSLWAQPRYGYVFQVPREVLLAADDDWMEVIWNLANARAVWRRTMRILIREGARLWVSEFFFKSVVQSVLIFGTER